MKYIITGVDNGKLLLWHPEEPIVVEHSLPHVIPSKPLPVETACSVLGKLASRDLPGVRVKVGKEIKLNSPDGYETMDFGTAVRYFSSSKAKIVSFQLVGPAGMKKQLLDLAQHFYILTKRGKPDPRNNVERINRMQAGWPLSHAENNSSFAHATPSIDELCSLPSDAFDSEFEGWERIYKFDDLDVDAGVLRKYLFSVHAHKEQANEDEIQAVELLSRVGQDEFLAHADKKTLVNLVLSHKLKNDNEETFGIGYMTSGGFPNFYFTKYGFSEDSTKVSTMFGDFVFENIVVNKVNEMDAAFEKIVKACGNKFSDKLHEYYDAKKKKVKTPSEAITFLFAITKRAYNALLTGGHNINSYDYPKIRGDPEHSFFVSGINGAVPKFDGDLQFYKRFVEPGRHNIDTCLLSQQFMSGSVDNKLGTFVHHLFGLKNAKGQSYDETTKKRLESVFGNLDSARSNGVYCMMDTVLHYFSMHHVKRSVYLLSLLLNQSPEVVCSTSYKQIAKKFLQAESLEKRGWYAVNFFGDFSKAESGKYEFKVVDPGSGRRISLCRLEFDDKKFDIEDEKNKLLLSAGCMTKTLFGFDECPADPRLRQALKTKVVNHADADIFYLTPFVSAFSHYLADNPRAVAVLDELSALSAKGGLEERIARQNRLILAQGLQQYYLSILVHSALNYSPSRGHGPIDVQPYSDDAHAFKRIFGLDLQDLNKRIFDAKEKFQNAVLSFGAEVVNSSTLTAITIPSDRRKAFIDFLEREKLGFYYGRANIVSTANSGTFLMYLDGEVMKQGIDAKFKRGLKNDYDSEFMLEFLRIVCEERDYRSAANLVIDTVNRLRSGRVDVNKLLYVTEENRKEPKKISARALNNRNVYQKVRRGVKKGERFAWGYSKLGPLHAPEIYKEGIDPSMYLKIMFGEERGKWTFRSYTYQKSDGGKAKDAIAVTSCGRLVESVLVYNTADKDLQKLKHDALERVVKGELNGDEIEILGQTLK